MAKACDLGYSSRAYTENFLTVWSGLQGTLVSTTFITGVANHYRCHTLHLGPLFLGWVDCVFLETNVTRNSPRHLAWLEGLRTALAMS